MARSLASRLSEFLRARSGFAWPDNNCTHLAADWVRQVEGRSVQPEGADGLIDSRRVLRRFGGSLEDVVTARLGRAPAPAAMARPGDVVLIDGGHTLGLCTGRTAAVMSAQGVAYLPMQAAIKAWHIEPAACATN